MLLWFREVTTLCGEDVRITEQHERLCWSYVTVVVSGQNLHWAFCVLPALICPASLPCSGGAEGHDAAEDASKAAEDCPLHGTGQLPPLASAPTPEDSAVHLRPDPPLPQRKPLHHRWLQGPPPIQALPQKVEKDIYSRDISSQVISSFLDEIISMGVSSLQHFYPVQWDGEHLEPPAWFPALLLSWGQWPLVCSASLWGQPGGLCHLCCGTLLLPGNCWLREGCEHERKNHLHALFHGFSQALEPSPRQWHVCAAGVGVIAAVWWWCRDRQIHRACYISRFPP